MNKGIVVVDLSGTFLKPFVAEEANRRRLSFLGLQEPDESDHKQQHATKSHYSALKGQMEQTYGITDDMEIVYTQNYGEEQRLRGKDVKTMLMTDLFRDAMYQVAREYRSGIFHDGMIESLLNIQKEGYALAIVSGMRTDIITGVFAIAGCPVRFEYIYGQDPVLSRDDNTILTNELSKHGQIVFIIGDKRDDLEPAKDLGAKSIFVSWGHARGGEEDIADYVVHTAHEIELIIKNEK